MCVEIERQHMSNGISNTGIQTMPKQKLQLESLWTKQEGAFRMLEINKGRLWFSSSMIN